MTVSPDHKGTFPGKKGHEQSMSRERGMSQIWMRCGGGGQKLPFTARSDPILLGEWALVSGLKQMLEKLSKGDPVHMR